MSKRFKYTVWITCKNGDENPVEIGICFNDVEKSKEKWIKIGASIAKVTKREMYKGERYNKVYGV